MGFVPPLSDFHHLLSHGVGYDRVAGTDRFAEARLDTAMMVLGEAGRFAADVVAPLQRTGDATPARLENGVVRMPPGFAAAYRGWVDGGWVGLAAGPEHGGMGMPLTLATAVNDMLAGACLSFQICPLLSQGQIDALEHHASADLRAIYLPKLVSGAWTGTMNLTEPQAGSDVGAVATRAEPVEDGTYRLTGQKIYISYGDHDLSENVCHLVLARLPGAPAGTRGISLFLVPQHLPDAQGRPGLANRVKVVGLETKLGLHAAPTATMAYEGATGWLVGAPHKGMAAMFTMMNNARLGVGVQGIGVAEAAYQQALAYACTRHQGATPGGAGPIVAHADVRRMLVETRADIFAARVIALSCAVAIDLTTATGDPAAAARAALLTPIAKTFGTETGIAAADTGIQIHGGLGVIEASGAAQFARDVRVTAIYEGTNGIQAMDLVSRKLADDGRTMGLLLDEVAAGAEAAPGQLRALAGPVRAAAQRAREATARMLASEPADRFAVALPYLRGIARVLGGHHHLRAAMSEAAPGPRTALARAYMTRLLPQHGPLLGLAGAGAADLMALSPETLAG